MTELSAEESLQSLGLRHTMTIALPENFSKEKILGAFHEAISSVVKELHQRYPQIQEDVLRNNIGLGCHFSTKDSQNPHHFYRPDNGFEISWRRYVMPDKYIVEEGVENSELVGKKLREAFQSLGTVIETPAQSSDYIAKLQRERGEKGGGESLALL